ncbi:hypothetical protein [Phyllobacterium sp. SB3]|uniref:hypothetical protein n=1 Tax=Phyllobacterium sp. SB3 TaxID=3156073 RepID=UPI0032AFB199
MPIKDIQFKPTASLNARTVVQEGNSLVAVDTPPGGPYQPLDSDLTAIAALSTTIYGRSLLTLANNAALATSLNGNWLPLTGGTLTGAVSGTALTLSGALNGTSATFSGAVTIPATGLRLNGNVGTARGIRFQTSGSDRWVLYTSGTAESGSDNGSNLELNRYNDAGTFLDTLISINRETGNTSLNGTILANYGQIRFPATQNPTTQVNTLDDYEEGTWTPVVQFGGVSTGITYNTQTGEYQKIGKWVYLSFIIILTNKGAATGSMLITGLPFTIGNIGGGGSLGGISQFQSTMTGLTSAPFYYGTSVTLSVFQFGATGQVAVTNANVNNTTRLQGVLFYPSTS